MTDKIPDEFHIGYEGGHLKMYTFVDPDNCKIPYKTYTCTDHITQQSIERSKIEELERQNKMLRGALEAVINNEDGDWDFCAWQAKKTLADCGER